MLTFLTTMNVTFWVSARHTRLSRPGARQARRAFPAHPMTAHSGLSNGGF